MAKRTPFDPTHNTFFFTSTIVGWIDLFIRPEYFQILYDSWNYCIREKGLVIHAYVIMPSHYHMIASTEYLKMWEIVKATKQFTSNKLYETIRESGTESRKRWLLNTFEYCGRKCPNNEIRQLWQQHSCPTPMWKPSDFKNTMEYIHLNPVKASLVHKPEYYQHSSAEFYSGGKNELVNLTPLIAL